LLVCVLAARSPAAVPARRGDLALALGFGLFVGIVFAYQIDIDSPLPVPRATWPIVAAVLLASAATREVRSATLPRLLAAAPLVALVVPLGLALTAPSLEVRGVGNGSYRLLDWNLHTGVNGDGQIDLETIARLIDDRDPDIVVLQEVGRGWPIAGANDQAEWLSRRLGMRYEWAPAADDQFGNLILSRFTMSDAEILRLPYGEGPQHRSALRVLVGTGPGAPVQVIGVHLQNGDVPATREDQIEAVLAAWPHDPGTVIAGDLNMQPTESNVTLFVDAGFASAQDDATIGDPDGSTARDPLFVGDRVDWIWVTPDVPYDTFAIVESEASDHLPLVVTAPEPRVAET
jgi:endonuclease/exonuclease/phosphatase family metal-dependent hydrolase